MFPSLLLAIATTLSSLFAVNGAIVQRQASFTYLTPQPTAPTTSIPSLPPFSAAPTSTTSTTPTSTSTTTSSIASSASTTSNSTSSLSATGASASLLSTTNTVSPTTTSGTFSTTATFSVPTSKTLPIPSGTTSANLTSVSPSLPPVTRTSTTPSPSGTPGAGANCSGIQQWQASFAYTAGDQVIFNGQLYTARQWTYNNAPPAHPDQWTVGGTCGQPINNQANCSGVAAWQSNVAYTAGNRVTFNNHLWSAVQWTESNAPGDTSGTWKDLGSCA